MACAGAFQEARFARLLTTEEPACSSPPKTIFALNLVDLGHVFDVREGLGLQAGETLGFSGSEPVVASPSSLCLFPRDHLRSPWAKRAP